MKTAFSESHHLVNERPRVRVLRDLKSWIEEGILPIGEVLPTEQALADQLKANRGTVRNAIRMLTEEGFIEGNGHNRIVVKPSFESKSPLHKPVSASSKTPSTNSSVLGNTVLLMTMTNDIEVSSHNATGWAELVDIGIIKASKLAKMHCLTLHDTALQTEEWQNIVASKPRGAFITDTLGSSPLARMALDLKYAGVPVVVFGNEPVFAGFDRVDSDQEAGAYMLTRWLIERGRRNILQIGFTANVPNWFVSRRAGYERAMREAGLEIMPLVDMGYLPFSLPDELRLKLGGEVTAAVLKPYIDKLDAIMSVSDGEVAPVMVACESLGRIPNRDIEIVGYDNYWSEVGEFKYIPYRPLATVDKCNADVGMGMVRLLTQRLSGKLPDRPQLRVLTPRLVEVN